MGVLAALALSVLPHATPPPDARTATTVQKKKRKKHDKGDEPCFITEKGLESRKNRGSGGRCFFARS